MRARHASGRFRFSNAFKYGKHYKNEIVIAVKCENADKSISNSLRIFTL